MRIGRKEEKKTDKKKGQYSKQVTQQETFNNSKENQLLQGNLESHSNLVSLAGTLSFMRYRIIFNKKPICSFYQLGDENHDPV